jgi:hypothetical protein
MMLPSTAPSPPTVTKLAPSRAANAQSGRSIPHPRFHRTEMTELVPRPQRHGKWRCGGAALKPTVMRAARGGVLRPCAAAALAFLVYLTRTGRQTRRPGGSLGSLATRAGASWLIFTSRSRPVPGAPTRYGRTNPKQRSPACTILAKRTRADPAISAQSRRTNPRPSNARSGILAKRTRARMNQPKQFRPNEPEQQRAARNMSV